VEVAVKSPFAAESGHWYHRDGSPCYEVPAKKGGMRATNIRDARALDLVPSVTTITALAARPGLEIWKQQQVMLAALTMPRIEGEADKAFVARLVADSREQAKKAAARGTAIHAAIEKSFRGEFIEDEFRPWVKAVWGVLPGGKDWGTERSFADNLFGFGGKVDLWDADGAGTVIDFKSKDGDLAGVECYDEHFMQLAAYRVGLGVSNAECGNMFISRDAPVALLRMHKPEDLNRGWRQFEALLSYWKATNL
jgi:hypothetical protein